MQGVDQYQLFLLVQPSYPTELEVVGGCSSKNSNSPAQCLASFWRVASRWMLVSNLFRRPIAHQSYFSLSEIRSKIMGSPMDTFGNCMPDSWRCHWWLLVICMRNLHFTSTHVLDWCHGHLCLHITLIMIIDHQSIASPIFPIFAHSTSCLLVMGWLPSGPSGNK